MYIICSSTSIRWSSIGFLRFLVLYFYTFWHARHAREIPRDKDRVRQGVLWTPNPGTPTPAAKCPVSPSRSCAVECHTVDSVKLPIFMVLPARVDLLNGCSFQQPFVGCHHQFRGRRIGTPARQLVAVKRLRTKRVRPDKRQLAKTMGYGHQHQFDVCPSMVLMAQLAILKVPRFSFYVQLSRNAQCRRRWSYKNVKTCNK